ncbi:hypothetical protein JXM83_03830 [Candidatus Woesearchaeota archaeon]|nr:hypothetical protein [Candidatus Woesearchaeota archaeon]
MSKKALMSIETMIIFIAVVLIAAIAAGLLIRTSGTLQQRAITVSDEARERIVTGVEIINIVADTELVNETLNDYEMLVRLKAGSYPIQLKDMNLMFTTAVYSISGNLQDSDMPALFDEIDVSSVDNASWLEIPNIETTNKRDVGSNEENVILVVNGSGDNEVLRFDLSYASHKDDYQLDSIGFTVPGQIIDVDLGIDLSNISGSGLDVELTDLPITNPVSGDIYGFVTIIGNATVNDSLTGLDAIITSFPTVDDCDFEKIIPNTQYCVITRVGENDDLKLERGELISIRFRVKSQMAMGTEKLMSFRLVPKGGAIEEVSIVTPSVFTLKKTNLWG